MKNLAGSVASITAREKMVDAQGLPLGLSDHVYASWRAALREVHDSPCSVSGKQRYQFCCGYLQALEDTGAIEGQLCRYLRVQVNEIWVDALVALNQRGL